MILPINSKLRRHFYVPFFFHYRSKFSPQESLMSTACKICNSNEISTLDKVVRGAQGVKVYYCQCCDFAFLSKNVFTDSFYKSDFNTFMAERSHDKSWNGAKEHFESRLKQADERLAVLSKYLNLNSIKSVLELGCSSGFFLKRLKDHYPILTVAGIEPGEDYLAYALSQNIEAYEKIEHLNQRKFDCLISYFVLEHIENPVEWINNLAKYVNPNGYIISIVPNLNEALVKTYKDNNYDQFVWQAPHLSYFSSHALKKLFSNISNNVSIYNQQRYTLSNHLNWLMGIKPQTSIEFSHITKEINTLYSQSLEKADLADSLIGICQL